MPTWKIHAVHGVHVRLDRNNAPAFTMTGSVQYFGQSAEVHDETIWNVLTHDSILTYQHASIRHRAPEFFTGGEIRENSPFWTPKKWPFTNRPESNA